VIYAVKWARSLGESFMIKKMKVLAAYFLAAFLVAAPIARAQSYPDKPVRIVVPFAAGGGVDVVARVMARHLSDKIGQNVYVENRPGASGNLGADVVMRSAADGYTLLISASTFVVNPVVAAERPLFDPLKDFTHIALIAKGPLLFIVNPDVASSVQEFVAKAKAEPSKYNFATGGFGSAGHMAAESFKIKAGLSIPVVLYRGTGPVFTDLMGGHISAIMDPLVTSLPLAHGGRAKALAISDSKRSSLAPEVPTFAEVGFKDFKFYTWYGLWGPPNIPASVVTKIEAAVQEIGRSPEAKKWFESQGLDYSGMSGLPFLDFERMEQSNYAAIMKAGNIARQ
jgi:tripartite-type tricarboxylate transporter receptor subunit TctC